MVDEVDSEVVDVGEEVVPLIYESFLFALVVLVGPEVKKIGRLFGGEAIVGSGVGHDVVGWNTS